MNLKKCPICKKFNIPEDQDMCFSCKIKIPVFTPKQEVVEICAEGKDTYLVYQGKTFEYEMRGGYVWAPLYNRNLTSFDHWSRVGLLTKGDIVLHSVGRHIVAISIVESEKYKKAIHPDNLWDEWYGEGRLVKCKYINLRNPISSLEIINDITRFYDYDGSPYNRDGKGKQGYMFDLDKRIFEAYMQKICERNTYIKYMK